jgi:hypothetical protein
MTAHIITTLQRCPREPQIERQHPGERPWYPKVLYERVIHAALPRLSRGVSKHEVVLDAVEYFTSQAARPGLITPFSPYAIAQDWIAIIKNSLEWISRTEGQELVVCPKVMVDDVEWAPTSLMGNGGMLHRFVAVNSLGDQNRLRQHLRSWEVVGDTCALASPMYVYFIKCGAARAGHQYSHWSRVFKHPALSGRFAFQAVDGKPLKGDWKPVWFADSELGDSKQWVDMMHRDKVHPTRVVTVKAPDEYRRAEFARHLKYESERLKNLPPWEELPVYRPACDVPAPCPWQFYCYATR